jgi:hypothetical protein
MEICLIREWHSKKKNMDYLPAQGLGIFLRLSQFGWEFYSTVQGIAKLKVEFFVNYEFGNVVTNIK